MVGCTGSALAGVFCESAARAIEELALQRLTVSITCAMKDGLVDTLLADRVPLVVRGEQRVHIVPSQSWRSK